MSVRPFSLTSSKACQLYLFVFFFLTFFFCISALNCLLRFPLAKQLLKPKFATFFGRGRGRAGPPLAQVSRMGLRTASGLPAQCRLTTSSWVGVGVQGAESLLCSPGSAALVLAGSDLVPGPGRALPARTFALINSRLPQACSTPPTHTHSPRDKEYRCFLCCIQSPCRRRSPRALIGCLLV